MKPIRDSTHSQFPSILLKLAYVAAFTVSSFANTATRTGKPFNPLLGETYECDRMEDLGWRCIAEQVRNKLYHHVKTGKESF